MLERTAISFYIMADFDNFKIACLNQWVSVYLIVKFNQISSIILIGTGFCLGWRRCRWDSTSAAHLRTGTATGWRAVGDVRRRTGTSAVWFAFNCKKYSYMTSYN